MLQLIWAPLIVIGIGISIVYFLQHMLIFVFYMPRDARTNVERPEDHNIEDWEEVWLTTPDHVRLHSYFIKYTPHFERVPTVLFLHSNAGNIGHRLDNAQQLMTRVKCNILLLEYRGYGLSQGSVSEEGLKIDAQTALDYLLARKDLQCKDIYLFGRSLGGAVAIDLAAHNPEHVTGLIIENTFTSVAALVDKLMPIFGYFAFLLTHRWPSLNTITRVRLPLLVLSGSRDEMIPTTMSQDLFDHCPAPKKELKKFPDGRHMETWICAGYFPTFAEFVHKHSAK